MRILLGADFHLGAPLNWLGPLAPVRRDDLNRSFVRFVDYALDPAGRIDMVLILGDLFDHHAPAREVVDVAVNQLERLLVRGMPVAAIPGTHDGIGYPDSIYRSARWPAGVTLLATPHVSRRSLEVKGNAVHLYGMAYDPARTPVDPLGGLKRDPEAGPGFHIGMVHGSLPAGMEWEFRRRDLPVPTADLSTSGLTLLAMGHYHNFLEKRFGDTTVVYPGTLEGLKMSEGGLRSFAVARVDEKGVTIERTPYPGREIVEHPIDLDLLGSSPHSLEEEITRLAGRDRIVKVILTGHAAGTLDAEALTRKLAPSFFHLIVDDRTLKVDERWAHRLAGEKTIRGLFVRKMTERIAAAADRDRPALEAALRAGLAEFGALGDSHGN